MGQKYMDKEAHVHRVAFSASRNPHHPQDTLLPVGWCAPLWTNGPVKGRHSKRLVVCNVCEMNTASHPQMPARPVRPLSGWCSGEAGVAPSAEVVLFPLGACTADAPSVGRQGSTQGPQLDVRSSCALTGPPRLRQPSVKTATLHYQPCLCGRCAFSVLSRWLFCVSTQQSLFSSFSHFHFL